MGLKSKILRQEAVLWEKIGDDAEGNEQYGPPQPIDVRWDEGVNYVWDEEKKARIYNDEVWTEEKVPDGSKLWLGNIKDLDSPQPPTEARRVLRYVRFGNFRVTEQYHICVV